MCKYKNDIQQSVRATETHIIGCNMPVEGMLKVICRSSMNEELYPDDEDGNPVVATDFCFMDYGKCIIFPNQRANSISLTDGSIYVYSYEVYVPLSKKKYTLIPREGDIVKIQKKDGTIDIEKEVKGFVTYKRKYLRLWL